jgi:hypothetical protein
VRECELVYEPGPAVVEDHGPNGELLWRRELPPPPPWSVPVAC